jgi:hypothetical protein
MNLTSSQVLLNVGKQAYDKKFYVIPVWSVAGIERIGYLAIIRKHMDAPGFAISSMSDLGMKYSSKQNNSAADRAFNGLISYGELAVENQLEFLVEPISYWSWLLCSSISKYSPKKTDYVIQKLLEFESYLMNLKSSTIYSYYKKGFNRAKISIKNSYSDLENYFEEIEKLNKKHEIKRRLLFKTHVSRDCMSGVLRPLESATASAGRKRAADVAEHEDMMKS